MEERMKYIKKEAGSESKINYKNYQKKSNKLPQIAATLQQVRSDVPKNMIAMLNSYNCKLCNSFIPSLKYAITHYNSDEHQTALRLTNAEYGHFELPFTPSEILDLESGVLICAEGSNTVQLVDPISKAKKEEIKLPESVDKINLEYCSICNVPFNSSLMALKHYGGKKHKQRFFAKLTAPSDPRAITEDFRCSVCSVSTSSEDNMRLHLEGKPHQKKLAKNIEENNNRTIPPETIAKWGAMDYNAEPDDSYQPFGIPAPFFDCKLDYHTPHMRLDGPFYPGRSKPAKQETTSSFVCTESRIGKDRFISIPEDVLRHYLETVYR